MENACVYMLLLSKARNDDVQFVVFVLHVNNNFYNFFAIWIMHRFYAYVPDFFFLLDHHYIFGTSRALLISKQLILHFWVEVLFTVLLININSSTVIFDMPPNYIFSSLSLTSHFYINLVVYALPSLRSCMWRQASFY